MWDCPRNRICCQNLVLVCHRLVPQHEDRIIDWRSLKEHLKCQTSSMLITKELVAVMNQKRQCHVVFSNFDPNLVDEEDLDHYVISYETYPFQRETHPSVHVP
ncbi:hypothetical protein Tco_1181716 [Tanacetum coccineum]